MAQPAHSGAGTDLPYTPMRRRHCAAAGAPGQRIREIRWHDGARLYAQRDAPGPSGGARSPPAGGGSAEPDPGAAPRYSTRPLKPRALPEPASADRP